MRIALVFAAALTLALATSGCCSSSCSRYSCSACDGSPASNCSWGCPKLPGQCCGWDFYVPCDLIEGRATRACAETQPRYTSGQVVSRSWAVPVGPCAPAPAAAGPALAAPPPLPAPVVRPEAP